MNITLLPKTLSGKVAIPSSKSYAHRLLIAAALSDSPVAVQINALNADIIATIHCLETLGVQVNKTDVGFIVEKNSSESSPVCLDCNESGSTLRFMLPVVAALGRTATFIGHGRLPQRPNTILIDVMRAHGVNASDSLLPLTLEGKLEGGLYEIAGNVSSQYITGLLLALPLCNDDSEIRLTTKLESAAYIDITLECLRHFSIKIETTATGWKIPGKQRYHSEYEVIAEGDWSSASFWLAANSIGSSIKLSGLNPHSVQGDRRMVHMLANLGSTLDVSDTPDLVPPLAIAAALHEGTTIITGAARLRLKESDRLQTVFDMLTALGANITLLEDGLIIEGSRSLSGGIVEGANDHRIVMAAAIAATRATGPITITDREAVAKSYPHFFDEYVALGGEIGG